MKSPEEKARSIIDLLAEQLGEGWQAFVVAKLVHEARSSGRINSAYYFFSSVELSCLESAFIRLTKIAVPSTNPRDTSINIQRLLNYSEQNPNAYQGADNTVIRSLVSEHKKELQNFKHLINNLKEQRDHTVIHLDEKHIKKPSAVYTFPPINLMEFESLYIFLLKVVDAYSHYLVPSNDIRLDKIAPGVTDDLQYLTSLLAKDKVRACMQNLKRGKWTQW